MKAALVMIHSLFLATATAALASPINEWRGNPIRLDISEDSPEVTWSISTTDATLESLAAQAVAQWENVDSAYITFRQVTVEEGGDIRFTILDSLSNSYAGGQALVSWDAEGIIQSPCLIEVLAEALNKGSSDYRRMLLTHEFGHCLGLAHSVVNGAVMSYRQPGPDLAFDDRYALTLTYPSSEASLPLGCATLARGSHGRGQGSGPTEGAFWLICVWLGHRLVRMKFKLEALPRNP